ncbi:MAG: APC family permease [Thermoplasmataceae archaeon]
MEIAESDKKLKKELTFIQLLFLSLGGIIGSGWLFGVLFGAAVAGPAAVFSWIIGGILVLFIALVYAEISGMVPKSGAIVRYPHYTHGSYTGYILGWAYLLSAVTVPSIEAIAAISYLSSFPSLAFLSYGVTNIYGSYTLLTGSGIVVAILLMVGFFFLNYFGIKFLGRWNEYFGYWKLIIPAITFVLLFALFRASNFTAYGGFTATGIPYIFLAIPTAGIVFSYLGFRQALEFGGEAKNPQRDIPRATIYSVIIAIALYSFLQLSFIGAIRWGIAGIPVTSSTFSSMWGSLGSSIYGKGPFYEVFSSAAVAGFGAWATILLIDGVISPSGTGWVYMGTSTRALYGLSTDGYYPPILKKIQESTGIPIVALILSLLIGSIFIAPFPSWSVLVGFISGATVFTYIMGGVVLTHFRKTVKDAKRPFKLPFSSIMAPIAFVSAALIVYWSGYYLEIILVYAILAGLPIYIIYYVPKNLKISFNLAAIAGIIFWAIEGVTIYLQYSYVIFPSKNNLSAGLSSPGYVFAWFPALFLIMAAATIGLTIFLYKMSKEESRKEIRSGLWLIGFILSLMPLSFYGAFGPYRIPTQVGVHPFIVFPWDNVLMIFDALVFYFLAIRSGLSEADVRSKLREEGVELKDDSSA